MSELTYGIWDTYYKMWLLCKYDEGLYEDAVKTAVYMNKRNNKKYKHTSPRYVVKAMDKE